MPERTTRRNPKRAMKAKKQQRKSAAATMQDVAQPKARPKRAKKAAAKVRGEFAPSAKAAKFKQEQHLQIDTKARADGKTEDDKRVAPPSSANKKRRRRSAFEIDRKFTCQVEGCLKAYGTESSLTHHQKLKHPDKLPEEAQEDQVGAFLLPLHTRNVTIRPATPLVTFASDPNMLKSQSSEDLVSTDIVPPSAKAQRCNARFRSNSLPVASATGEVETVDTTPHSNPIGAKTPKVRAKTLRKPRRAATPHPKKAATAARNALSRSRSESLTELQPLEECKPPPNHEAILPLSSSSSGGPPSFEWPPSPLSAAGHHSTSLSSDEQAIDSDILSVLANCDAEETIGPAAVLGFGPSYPSTSASFVQKDDAEMLPVGLECFKIAEHSTLPTQVHDFPMNEPEAELGLNAFATLGDDWANALHLSTHLEKMSVASPAHHLESAFAAPQDSQRVVARLRSASDPSYAATPMMFGLTHMSPAQSVGNALSGQITPNAATFQSWGDATTGSTLEPGKVGDAPPPRQMFWMPNEANVATVDNSPPSSQALDELLQNDDTLEWKTSSTLEGNAEFDYGLGDATMTSALL